jgi:hypothetical protein
MIVPLAAVTTATSDIERPHFATAATAAAKTAAAAAAPPKKRPACWWLGLAVLAVAALSAISAIATLSAEVRQLNIQLAVERSSSSSRALQQLNQTECVPIATAFNGTRRLEVGVTSTRSMQLTADLMGGAKGTRVYKHLHMQVAALYMCATVCAVVPWCAICSTLVATCTLTTHWTLLLLVLLLFLYLRSGLCSAVPAFGSNGQQQRLLHLCSQGERSTSSLDQHLSHTLGIEALWR